MESVENNFLTQTPNIGPNIVSTQLIQYVYSETVLFVTRELHALLPVRANPVRRMFNQNKIVFI